MREVDGRRWLITTGKIEQILSSARFVDVSDIL